jgi:hypothetical protein
MLEDYKMKKMFVFMNNAIIIPILPCIVNVFIKLLCNAPFGWDYLDKGTLTFSISLYLLTCLKGSLKNSDPDVVKGASAIYIVLLFLTVVLFTVGMVFDTLYEIDLAKYVNTITEQIDSGKVLEAINVARFFPRIENSSMIGVSTIIFGIAGIVFSEYIRYKHKIEGDIV